MSWRSVSLFAAACAGIWFIGRSLWRRGDKREIVLVAVCLLWSVYLIAGADEAWPPITPLTAVKFLLEPLGRGMSFGEWR